jgi:predicted  nucleic acid-binding Zn-ribbon protein
MTKENIYQGVEEYAPSPVAPASELPLDDRAQRLRQLAVLFGEPFLEEAAAELTRKDADLAHATSAFMRAAEERDHLNAEVIPDLNNRLAIAEAALKECADDLEAELQSSYQHMHDYPSQMAKFERDMAPVYRARAALSPEAKG